MAEICCGVVSESKPSDPCEKSSRAARRRRIEIRRLKFVTGEQIPVPDTGSYKRQKIEASLLPSSPRECLNAVDTSVTEELKESERENKGQGQEEELNLNSSSSSLPSISDAFDRCLNFGVTSVCGRRRDMEDAVAIHPSFCRTETRLHYFGVYDGHGCSHVATSCKNRLHDLVAEELGAGEDSVNWKEVMERSFKRMDTEVVGGRTENLTANCRCELQTPKCDAVGSTAVVAVISPEKIVVANCGDSRAVLCRNGKPIPLSSDHKPDRPDELNRIQDAGGRVIYWDGPRVLGVLAMSRAIGDNYLKPFVISEPEVTVTERSPDDECLILASDGLWDVVSNDTACSIVRMCLRGIPANSPGKCAGGKCSGKGCSDAAILLTKLALGRQSTDNVSVVVVDLRSDT
ncbi:putative protein phosphatase 2C 24 [Tasmannia lanceolata]|uniref:putative protein phosphatase 2C 24 n=1 Tax=Tasmannia lanceolata TaxID=3420 RepID=UPI004062DA73